MRGKVVRRILWAVALVLMISGILALLTMLYWFLMIVLGPGPKLMAFGPGAPMMWLKHAAPALLLIVVGVMLALRLRRPSLTLPPL